MKHCSEEFVAQFPGIEEEITAKCPICNPKVVRRLAEILPSGTIGKPEWALGWTPEQGFYEAPQRAAMQQQAALQQQMLSREYRPWGIFGNILRRKS